MTNLFITSILAAAESGTNTPPVFAPDYGSDISCTDDCDALFSELDGDDPRLVAESCWRSITSTRGSIPGAPDAGWDIQQLLRLAASPSDQRTWPGLVRAELSKDDRILEVSVKFKQTASDAWTLTIDGTTVDGTFSLVGALTPTSAVLQEILTS